MAHGDTRTLTRGKYAGNTLREISVAAGTSDADMVLGKADKRINVVFCLLNNSVAADLAFKERDASTSLLPLTLGAGASFTVDADDQVITSTKGKALDLTRSASTAIKGYIVFNYSG